MEAGPSKDNKLSELVKEIELVLLKQSSNQVLPSFCQLQLQLQHKKVEAGFHQWMSTIISGYRNDQYKNVVQGLNHYYGYSDVQRVIKSQYDNFLVVVLTKEIQIWLVKSNKKLLFQIKFELPIDTADLIEISQLEDMMIIYTRRNENSLSKTICYRRIKKDGDDIIISDESIITKTTGDTYLVNHEYMLIFEHGKCYIYRYSMGSFTELMVVKKYYHVYLLENMVRSNRHIERNVIRNIIELYNEEYHISYSGIIKEIYRTIYDKNNTRTDHYCQVSPNNTMVAYIKRISNNEVQLFMRSLFNGSRYDNRIDYQIKEGNLTLQIKWICDTSLYVVTNTPDICSEIISISGDRRNLKEVFGSNGDTYSLQYNEKYHQMFVNYPAIQHGHILGYHLNIYTHITPRDILLDDPEYISEKKIDTIEYATYLSHIDEFNLIYVRNKVDIWVTNLNSLFKYNLNTKESVHILDIESDIRPDQFEFTLWSNQLFISDRKHLYYPTGREKLCMFLNLKPTHGYNFISDSEMQTLIDQWYNLYRNMEQYKNI